MLQAEGGCVDPAATYCGLYYRVVIPYREPLFEGRTGGRRERPFLMEYVVAAEGPEDALAKAVELFRKTAAASSVGWRREIIEPEIVVSIASERGHQKLVARTYDGEGRWLDGPIVDPETGQVTTTFLFMDELEKATIRTAQERDDRAGSRWMLIVSVVVVALSGLAGEAHPAVGGASGLLMGTCLMTLLALTRSFVLSWRRSRSWPVRYVVCGLVSVSSAFALLSRLELPERSVHAGAMIGFITAGWFALLVLDDRQA